MTELKKNQVRINARLSFARLNKPEAFNGQGKPRYTASFIIEPGSKAEKDLVSAMKFVAVDEWGEANGKKTYEALVRTQKTCLNDGNNKPDIAEYQDMLVINGAAQVGAPPSLVYTKNGKNVAIDDDERENQSIIYSGCMVNVRLNIWAQDNDFGKRINAGIAGVQFAGDGDRLGGSASASINEFDTVEVEPDNVPQNEADMFDSTAEESDDPF